MKQAALEAAKVRAGYAARGAVLKKEKAQIMEQQTIAEAARVRKKEALDADIDLLNQEKELAAFAAEIHVLETKSNPSENEGFQSLPIEDPLERVEQFINAQKQNQNTVNTVDMKDNEIIEISTTNSSKSYVTVKQENDQDVFKNQVVKPKNEFSESSAAEFTKFLLRKDLTLSRLYSFNVKPESFRVLKSSFNEVVKEIGVTPSEEIDFINPMAR